jgi:hypothetical protein
MNHRRSPALAALDGLVLLFVLAVALMCAPVLLTVILWLFCGMPHRPGF